ncbi:uncharacterized protein LOC131602927 [Vicia villosa]|uniref:uncharacterized protein LOC131602927 n=1 Tax=Vicia villosa TaxID=3911 RepID=UPI00273AA648|nr:uncharacterized protein LOC131602927 [Vicia villosa]
MPLLRKKPFALTEPPQDLKPEEHVYQVRFTKEIFRNYSDYLSRLNLYRQRVWACKVTGKTGLTYEEALVSEQRATEKFLQFPKEFMTPALKIIQYSMVPLKELADSIYEKLQERLFVGAELYGKKDDNVCPCRILKVIQEGVNKYRYEVAWLDKTKNVSEKTEICAEDLVQKKPLFSRNILKSFIRESTYRNAPWVLHDKLAQNHGISTDVPEELRGKVFLKDGLIVCSKKRNNEESMEEADKRKKNKLDRTLVNGSAQEKENGECKEIPIKYPIDDLLVKPSPDDPVFTDRPSPSRDFNVPVHCVGDLLMVWDFCTSFGKQLNLWPYSLEDFENAICHKDSNVVLLVESHAALFRVLIKDDGEYTSVVEKRKLKKITMVNWREYLCDFLEMINIPRLRNYEAIIRRGHYGLVDANAKLELLSELVNRVIETAVFREKFDKIMEQRHELGASKREVAIELGRKRREKKERLKADLESNGHHLVDSADILTNNNHIMQNGHMEKKTNGEIESSRQDNSLGSSGIKHSGPASEKTPKNLDSELKEPPENGKEVFRKKLSKQLKAVVKDSSEKNSIERRREYFEREMEKRTIRRSPLGKDRDYNRYWWFRRDGRIFVESCDSKEWGYYSSKEELDALMGSLNCKGERERVLQKQLEKNYTNICSELQKRSKDLAQNIAIDEAVLRRSTRVRAPPRENPAHAFLKYVNKWKDE